MPLSVYLLNRNRVELEGLLEGGKVDFVDDLLVVHGVPHRVFNIVRLDRLQTKVMRCKDIRINFQFFVLKWFK